MAPARPRSRRKVAAASEVGNSAAICDLMGQLRGILFFFLWTMACVLRLARLDSNSHMNLAAKVAL